MSIDISNVSSLLNQLTATSTTKKSNNYSIDFSEYLLNSMSTQKKTTNVNDLSNALSLNINDTASLKSTIEQALKSNSTTDITQLLNLLTNQQQNSNTISNLLGTNNSTSRNGVFTSQSSQTSGLQTPYDSSSTTNDTISDALQTNFLSKQLNLMQTAYNKLQANLEDYKERNAGIESDAVNNRILEMTKNVSTLQTYMQEKLAEKATNESLMNQLNANGRLSSMSFK